jgi:hypothetical protein
VATIVEKFVVKGDSTSAQKASKDAGESLTGAFLKSQIAMAALSKAYNLFVDGLKEGIKNALEFERTTLRLEIAVKRFAQGNAASVDSFNREASALERLTGISDEVFRNLQTTALQMGVMPEQVNKFTRAAQLLSQTMGIDANSALKQLTKTLSGLQGELGESLPFVKALTKEELMQGKAIDLVLDKWGEFIDVTTKGDGALAVTTRLNTGWANFTETLGKAALNIPIVTSALDDLGRAMNVASQLFEQGRIGEGLVSLVSGAEGRIEIEKMLLRQEENLRLEEKIMEMRRKERERGLFIPTEQTAAGGASLLAQQLGGFKKKFPKEKKKTGKAFEDISFEDFERMSAERDKSVAERKAQTAWEANKQIESMHREHLATLEAQEIAYIDNEFTQNQQVKMDIILAGTQAIGQALQQTFIAMLEGQKVTGKQVIATVMKSMGSVLFSKGVMDVAMGTAMLFSPIPTDEVKAPFLIKSGLAEMALGSVALAGGVLTSKGKGGGAIGGRGGGGGGDFAGGAVGGVGGGEGGGERVIIINVQGAAITDAGVGVQIMNSIDEATRQGLIPG